MKMIQLQHHLTGRPVFVDATAVSAILDAIEMNAPALAGGRPTPTIVGTLLIVGGAQIPVAGDASQVSILILAAIGVMSEEEAQSALAEFAASAKTKN